MQFDNSPAALRLWNFLLTENERLHQARANGDKIVGTMKDLGTVPVMAYALPGVRAFYPDGAWWTPCLMECSDKLLQQAEAMGIDASFCPVRAMLPAFVNGEHFPRPDLLVCSTGAICDDFSAIAQRLEHLGHSILWWEIPRRRQPAAGETACALPGHLAAPKIQVDCVRAELQRVGQALGELAGKTLDDDVLAAGIRAANQVRRLLDSLRRTVYAAPAAPLPALEMLVAEMLAHSFLLRPRGNHRRARGLAGRGSIARPAKPVCHRRRRRADFLGESGRGFARDEPAGRTRRTHLRFGLHVHPRAGFDSRKSAAAGSAGPHRAGRSDGWPDGRPRRAHRPRMSGQPRRGRGRLAHSRREPLRARGGNHP